MPQNLVTIPKLETQWKILYDVKRTEYLQVENPRKIYVTLSIYVGRDAFLLASVSPPQILLGGYLQGDAQQFAAGNQVPKVGEWTRIEIGHEEEDGKYFLSLAVGGEQVGRGQVTDRVLKSPTDVRLNIGCPPRKVVANYPLLVGPYSVHPLPGYVRRVVVLQK